VARSTNQARGTAGKRRVATGSPRAQKARPAPAAKGRRIGVLSRNAKLYSTARLIEAAALQGQRLRVIDTLQCGIVVEQGRPAILYEGREVDFDVVIPRIGASITTYGLAVVSQFEMMGVPVVNGASAIAQSRDKLRGLQVLAKAGIPVPRTVMTRTKTDVADAVRRVGGLPAIVKLTQGTQGIGVMIAHSMAEIRSILDTMWDLGQEILLQEFIAESKGKDVRVLVVGDRAVAAMRRTAKKGDFRSNIHRGGEGEPVELTAEYGECALRAARVLGLEVAGIDLLETRAGPRVVEANSSPGFEGIEAVTGLGIAGLIIAHAVSRARLPARSRRVRG
jgi:ribosomal protein S6--L-glutamate ligase